MPYVKEASLIFRCFSTEPSNSDFLKGTAALHGERQLAGNKRVPNPALPSGHCCGLADEECVGVGVGMFSLKSSSSFPKGFIRVWAALSQPTKNANCKTRKKGNQRRGPALLPGPVEVPVGLV